MGQFADMLVSGDETLEELIESVGMIQKQLDHLLTGNLNSKNIREIGNWLVGPDYFKARNGQVGISSLVTGSDDVRFWAGDTDMDTAPWRVYESGHVFASDADISGKITATEGEIGGWIVSEDSLKDNSGIVGILSTVTAGDDIRFFAGDVTPSNAPFRVTESGVLTAESGTVGGWTLSSTKLSGSGILEGGTIQTQSSGERIVISNNSLKTYSSGGDLNGLAWGTDVSGNLFGDAFFYHEGTKLIEFFDDISGGIIRGGSGAIAFTLGGNGIPTLGSGTWEFSSSGSVDLKGTTKINSGSSLNSITQSDSAAATIPDIVSDFNELLSNLRNLNILAT